MRAQYIVAAIIPALIVILSITGFVWAQKRVTIVVDGRSAVVDTQASDVAGLLKQLEIEAIDGDIVSPSSDQRIAVGMTVVVRHAIPVTVDLGGVSTRLRVVGRTVAAASYRWRPTPVTPETG